VAKVADFGLAKAFELAGLSGFTETGMWGGTLEFMPHQQLINFKYAKPEVDVWAMAASLYYMLTDEYARDFVGDDAIPIRGRDPSIPEAVAQVIDRALVDDPAIVYKTADDLRMALEAVGLEG
jgi:eukaryotic-like serine/threonine-protein kinase